MAQKKITDLQLIGAVTDDLNLPSDNGIQSYRCTATQIKNYVLAAGNVDNTALADLAVTAGKLAEAVQQALTPVGTILAYAGDTAPAGYLICQGATVSRATYANLFALVDVRFGQGDGSTTFHLPDLRGRFLRGRANDSTNDPDRASRTAMNTGGSTGDSVGSVQSHENASHTHIQNAHSHTFGHAFTNDGGGNIVRSGATSVGTTTSDGTTAVNQTSGGNESRPKNAYVNYIIKF